MALVEATAMHGRGLGALSLAFDMQGLYGDGGGLPPKTCSTCYESPERPRSG